MTTCCPLEGFQQRSAEKVIASIEASKQRPFGRVLFALGIPHVGDVNAQLLADEFGSIEALAHAAPEEIAAVEGVGSVIAEAVSSWFLDEEHAEVVRALADAGVQMSGARRERAVDGPLAGKVVVVTGAIEGHTRDSIREHLTAMGAKVTDSISKKTDYLIAGDGGGSKRDKAEQLGVPVVTLEELERLALRVLDGGHPVTRERGRIEIGDDSGRPPLLVRPPAEHRSVEAVAERHLGHLAARPSHRDGAGERVVMEDQQIRRQRRVGRRQLSRPAVIRVGQALARKQLTERAAGSKPRQLGRPQMCPRAWPRTGSA